MKKIKKLGSAVLLALFGFGCTTNIESSYMKSSYMLAALSGSAIHLWGISADGKNDEELQTLDVPSSRFFGHGDLLGFSSNGQYILLRNPTSTVHVWDVWNKKKILLQQF